jgi:hypothetical protein
MQHVLKQSWQETPQFGAPALCMHGLQSCMHDCTMGREYVCTPGWRCHPPASYGAQCFFARGLVSSKYFALLPHGRAPRVYHML